MTDLEYMQLAYREAEKAYKEGEIPVGAIIVKDNVVIGKGFNKREKNFDISSHAEIEAIKEAEQAIKDWRLDGCTMYVTLEPCLMCAGAIIQSRISKIIFAAKDERDGAIVSNYFVYDNPSIHQRPLVYFGIMEEECNSLMKVFFATKRK